MDWALFLLKKMVSLVFCPTMIALLLWFVGIILWRRSSQSRLAFGCIVAGGVVLLVASLSVTPLALITALEHEAGSPADPADLARKGVRSIVVLGGGVRHGSMGTTSIPDSDSLARAVEGVRLWKGIPGARLILSGGKYTDETVTSAEAMAWAAKLLGVPDDAIVLEATSWDTDDEALYLKPIVRRETFALVTSAVHMKRALLTFRMRGLDPIPSPTDYLARGIPLDFRFFVPGSVNVAATRTVLREIAGLLWLTLKAPISGRSPV